LRLLQGDVAGTGGEFNGTLLRGTSCKPTSDQGTFHYSLYESKKRQAAGQFWGRSAPRRPSPSGPLPTQVHQRTNIAGFCHLLTRRVSGGALFLGWQCDRIAHLRHRALRFRPTSRGASWFKRRNSKLGAGSSLILAIRPNSRTTCSWPQSPAVSTSLPVASPPSRRCVPTTGQAATPS
jgi:hypothetical protein